MRKIFLTMAFCAAAVGAAPVFAAGAADDIGVKDPYARAVPPGQPNSAAFLGLSNNGAASHALVGAKSTAADVVELHTHLMEGGMMKMRRVPRIEVPAGQTVSLQPGGLHLMLIGLKQPLKPENPIDLTLVFEDDSTQELRIPVKTVESTMMKH